MDELKKDIMFIIIYFIFFNKNKNYIYDKNYNF